MKDKLQLVKEKMQNAYLMKVAGLTAFLISILLLMMLPR